MDYQKRFSLSFPAVFLLSFTLSGQFLEIPCEPQWRQTFLGSDMGEIAFYTEDLDNDGNIEILVSGSEKDLEQNTFFHILEYTDSLPHYRIEYQSQVYREPFFRDIKVFDLEGDGTLEILIMTGDYVLEIYRYQNSELIYVKEYSFGEMTSVYEVADADNDGEKELLTYSFDSQFSLRNPETFEVEHQLPLFPNGAVKVGNVDNDPENEIVVSSKSIYQFDGVNLTEEWSDLPTNAIRIHLSDIDNDGMEELLTTKSFSNDLLVYDADLQQLKYEIDLPNKVDQITSFDVTGDSIPEIIIGDQGPQFVRAFDGMTQTQLWTVKNYDHGIAGLTGVDIDNDNQKEIIFVAGNSSTGPDRINVFDAASQAFEWETPHVETYKPFNVFDIGDIDSDGDMEIVYFQKENSQQTWPTPQYNVLGAIDANTKALEWRTDINSEFADEHLWDWEDLKIADINDDGKPEIVLIADHLEGASLYIFNPETQKLDILYSYPYTEIPSLFNTMEIADIDNDNQTEIIIGGKSSDLTHVYIINGTDGSLEWSSQSFGPGTGKDEFDYLHVADIDLDGVLEIIVENDRVYVFDGITHDMWESPEDDVLALTVGQYDDDPQLEIIYHTDDFFGAIPMKIRDGITLDLEHEFKTGIEDVIGLKIADLNQNNVPEFYVTAKGRLYLFENPDNILVSPPLSGRLGFGNKIFITDYNGFLEDPVFLFNSNYAIIELGSGCYNCLSFKSDLIAKAKTCAMNPDGELAVHSTGGEAPFTYSWNSGSTDSLLTGLDAGTYSVTVEDANGCISVSRDTLFNPELNAELSSVNATCSANPDGLASAEITVGLPPFLFEWNNGENSENIENLQPGSYSITITDANECIFTDSIIVNQSELLITGLQIKPDCNGMNSGEAAIMVNQGLAPFNFDWSNGAQDSLIGNLSSGIYTVTVTDAAECTAENAVDISTGIIEITTDATPSCNDLPGGTASLWINEGTPPFQYQWSTGGIQPWIFGLSAGEYSVTVTSANGCSAIDSVIVNSVTFVTDFVVDLISCFGADDGSLEINVIEGAAPYIYSWNTGDSTSSIENLPPGFYSGNVEGEEGCISSYFIQLEAPPELILSGTSSPDSLSTPLPDGTAEVTPTGGTPPYLFQWNDPDSQTTQIATGLSEGEYTVTVTDENGCEQFLSVTVDMFTSVTENEKILSANVFPNPTNESFVFELDSNYKTEINLKLYNSLGREINISAKKTVGRNSWEINLTDLPPGIYWLEAYFEGEHNSRFWRVIKS